MEGGGAEKRSGRGVSTVNKWKPAANTAMTQHAGGDNLPQQRSPNVSLETSGSGAIRSRFNRRRWAHADPDQTDTKAEQVVGRKPIFLARRFEVDTGDDPSGRGAKEAGVALGNGGSKMHRLFVDVRFIQGSR